MYPSVKRGCDLLFAGIGLVLLLPVLLPLLLLIRLDSPGFPLFAQTRIGRGGKPFTVYKLRTMRRDAPRSVATMNLAQAHITRLGAFLRKTSLDELPQLYNILRGDMSFIGPRPLIPEEEHVHAERMAKGVYVLRPGITGWAQINGRDQVCEGMKAELDAYYAQHLSLALDLRILIITIVCVLTARGIQEGSPTPTPQLPVNGKEPDAQSDDH